MPVPCFYFTSKSHLNKFLVTGPPRHDSSSVSLFHIHGAQLLPNWKPAYKWLQWCSNCKGTEEGSEGNRARYLAKFFKGWCVCSSWKVYEFIKILLIWSSSVIPATLLLIDEYVISQSNATMDTFLILIPLRHILWIMRLPTEKEKEENQRIENLPFGNFIRVSLSDLLGGEGFIWIESSERHII